VKQPNPFLKICFFFLLAILASLFNWFLAKLRISVNIYLLLVMAIALWRGRMSGQLWGFFLGFWADVFSIYLFGLNSFLLTLIGFVVGNFRQRLDEESIFTWLFLGLLGSLGYCLGKIILLKIFVARLDFILLVEMKQIVVNLLFSPIIFYLYRRFFRYYT